MVAQNTTLTKGIISVSNNGLHAAYDGAAFQFRQAVGLLINRLAGPEGGAMSGHFGANYWMLEAFAQALLKHEHSPIVVYQTIDCCAPGIRVMISRVNAGRSVPGPDYGQKPLSRTVIPAISRRVKWVNIIGS